MTKFQKNCQIVAKCEHEFYSALCKVFMTFTQHFAAILRFFSHFIHICSFLQCEYCEIGNVSMGFSKSLMPKNSLQITRLRPVIWQDFWHLWFGKPHAHVSSSQYSMIAWKPFEIVPIMSNIICLYDVPVTCRIFKVSHRIFRIIVRNQN